MARVQTVALSPRARKGYALAARRTMGPARLPRRHGQKIAGKPSSFAFAVLLFCSGVAALVYQVLWIKQLSLIVGVEVYSISVAVSAFFAGLALGGFLLGRWADRLDDPLRLYAILEGGIAVLGVAATLFLSHTAAVFAALEIHAGVLAWALPFLLVGIPAVLMGGTLPVAVRSWFSEDDRIAGIGGSSTLSIQQVESQARF